MELDHKAQNAAATEPAMQELKRLEVAKALATNPKLLLLDEVLAGLENQATRMFIGKLKEINTTLGIVIIIVEHDIKTISKLCSRAIASNFGQLIADGTSLSMAYQLPIRKPGILPKWGCRCGRSGLSDADGKILLHQPAKDVNLDKLHELYLAQE